MKSISGDRGNRLLSNLQTYIHFAQCHFSDDQNLPVMNCLGIHFEDLKHKTDSRLAKHSVRFCTTFQQVVNARGTDILKHTDGVTRVTYYTSWAIIETL